MVSDGANNFVKAWVTVIVSLCYCFAVGKLVRKGTKRLILVIPVVYIFCLVPLEISSVHLCGTTAFFVAWLANFKLLLFAFGRGPLSSDPPLALPLFLAVSCLPIKIHLNPKPPKSQFDGGARADPPLKSHPNDQNKQNPSPKSHLYGENGQNPAPKPHLFAKSEEQPCSDAYPDGQKGENLTRRPKSREGPLNYTIKGLLLFVLVKMYDYSDFMHPKILLTLYAFHIYFILELILAIGAAMARAISGLELEAQFNEPYLATSLQDFWGRRWNLMVTGILRPTVYEPSLRLFSAVVGRNWAPLPAVFGTFVASALMHELMFYYLGRLRPAWEVTWFFLVHGFCMTAEIAVKKAVGSRWRIPTAAARVLTVGFVMTTGLWLFVPAFTRCEIDKRAFEEYAAVGALAKRMYLNAFDGVCGTHPCRGIEAV